MEIKVLGTGCQKCRALYKLVENVLTENDITADLEKIEDVQKIVSYGVMMTPALVMNCKVKVAGKVPGKDQIKKYIDEEINA